jgi:hypothetical protein
MVGERVEASGGRPKVQIMLKTGVKTPVRVRFPHNQMLLCPRPWSGESYSIARAGANKRQ